MGTLLTKLGPVLMLGLFFLAELLAALFLFSFWQRLKAVQKKNKRESSAENQGDELLLEKTKAALLTLRLSPRFQYADRPVVFPAAGGYPEADGAGRSRGKPGIL